MKLFTFTQHHTEATLIYPKHALVSKKDIYKSFMGEWLKSEITIDLDKVNDNDQFYLVGRDCHGHDYTKTSVKVSGKDFKKYIPLAYPNMRAFSVTKLLDCIRN